MLLLLPLLPAVVLVVLLSSVSNVRNVALRCFARKCAEQAHSGRSRWLAHARLVTNS